MSSQVAVRAILSIVSISAPALADDVHWQYGKGHGSPAHWSELSPDFATCGVGKQQSPIDIVDARKAQLPEIQFAYRPSRPKIVNNGHTIQVALPPGNSITVGDHKYKLVQFHFHAPSEEAISGKRTPLVAHFVHKDADGKLAVIGVLFDVGAQNAALTPVFGNMPPRAGNEVALDNV